MCQKYCKFMKIKMCASVEDIVPSSLAVTQRILRREFFEDICDIFCHRDFVRLCAPFVTLSERQICRANQILVFVAFVAFFLPRTDKSSFTEDYRTEPVRIGRVRIERVGHLGTWRLREARNTRVHDATDRVRFARVASRRRSGATSPLIRRQRSQPVGLTRPACVNGTRPLVLRQSDPTQRAFTVQGQDLLENPPPALGASKPSHFELLTRWSIGPIKTSTTA